MTDDAEQRPCQRCLRKGLLCEYVPVSDGAQYAASSDNSGTHSSHTQPTNTASRSHPTTDNYSATHGHSGYSQTMSHPSYHYQHGNRLINPGSSSYPVPRGQIYNPPVSPPTRPHYATPTLAPHSVSPPAFSGNYGYPNQWPQSSPPSTQPQYVSSRSKFGVENLLMDV